MHDPAAAAFQAAALMQEEQRYLTCPRCDSTNTKFCYYNNYNLSQPRHYCRDCRRYWTRGGALRNVPVGGGTRKNSKRPASSSSPSSVSPSKRPNAPSSAATSAAASASPTGTSPATPLRSLNSGNAVAPTPTMPTRAPAQEDVLRLQADANCWNGGGGGRPDLSTYTPGSKFQ